MGASRTGRKANYRLKYFLHLGHSSVLYKQERSHKLSILLFQIVKSDKFSAPQFQANRWFHERVSWKYTACSSWQKIETQSCRKKPWLERNHTFLKRYLILIDDILLLQFGSSLFMTHYVFKYINYIINNLYHYNVLWFHVFKTVSNRWGSYMFHTPQRTGTLRVKQILLINKY